MRLILIGAAFAAVSALPASAYEIREYSMHADPTQVRPGMDYVVTDEKGKKIRVIEGQPRWTHQRYTSGQPHQGDFFPSLSGMLPDYYRD